MLQKSDMSVRHIGKYLMVKQLNTSKVGPLPPWHGTSSACRWRRWPPDIEGSCKYTEYTVAKRQQVMVLQLGGWAGVNNPRP
jgi:hypothetical protein